MVDYSKWANLADDSDEERESVLAERVRRGAALPSPPSASRGSSGQSLEVDRSAAGAARLKAELESQLSSLSLEEANEALRQAEATLNAAKSDGKPPLVTEKKLQSTNSQTAAAAAVPTAAKPTRTPGSKAAAELPPDPSPTTKARGKKKSGKKTLGGGGSTTGKTPAAAGAAAASAGKLEAIQKEMAEMMQTLQQVEKAAADAKSNANEVSALVEVRRKEVAAAESEQESSKQELDASFARMKSGLQAEAAAGGLDPQSVALQSPEELELAAAKAQAMAPSTESGTGAAGVNAFSDALKSGGQQGADLASTLGSAHPLNRGLSGFFGNGMNARPAAQATLPQRQRAVTLHAFMAVESFAETGKVRVQYQFKNNAGIGSGEATSSQEKDNCASDRDFVSVFEESAGSIDNAQSTEQKVHASGWVPKNANDYLDFNYVDDAQALSQSCSENNTWEQGGKVNLAIGSTHRKTTASSNGQGRRFIACYFGDDGDSDAPPLLLACCRVLVDDNETESEESSAASSLLPAVNAATVTVRVAIESDDEDDEDIDTDTNESPTVTDASRNIQRRGLLSDQYSDFEDTECSKTVYFEGGKDEDSTGPEFVILEQLRNIKCFQLSLPSLATNTALTALSSLTASTKSLNDGNSAGVATSAPPSPSDGTPASARDFSQSTSAAPSLASVLGLECTPQQASLLWPIGIASAATDAAAAGKGEAKAAEAVVVPSQGAVLSTSADATPLQPMSAHQLRQQRVVILDADAVGVGALLPQQVVVAQQGSRLVIRLPYAISDSKSTNTSSSTTSSSPKTSMNVGNEIEDSSSSSSSSSSSAAARRHAALVAKRRAERVKRSRAARAAAAGVGVGVGASKERGQAVTGEAGEERGGGAASKSVKDADGNHIDNNNDKKGSSSSSTTKDKSTDAAPGAVHCGFCDATLAVDGALEAARPGPVGMLDDLCWDLMCAACPVLDLSARNLPVPPKVCWITDTSLALPPQALCDDNSTRNTEALFSVVPTPGRIPFNERLSSEEGDLDDSTTSFSSSLQRALSCRRCLQVVGEADEPIADALFGIGTKEDHEDTSTSRKSRLIAASAAEGQVRLFRHKVAVTNRPDLGQALRTKSGESPSGPRNSDTRSARPCTTSDIHSRSLAAPSRGRTAEHYVSLQLVASAAAKHAFQFQLMPPFRYRTGTTASSSGSRSSANRSSDDSIGLQIQSWTTLIAMLPLHALRPPTLRKADWSELWSSLTPVVKVRFGGNTVESYAASASSNATRGEDIGGDGGDVLTLEMDEWREVIRALETSASASGSSRQHLAQHAGNGKASSSRVGWLKLPMDFDGAAPM